MPKEKINDETQANWFIEISWKRDEVSEGGTPGHVQVASVNTHSPFEFPEKSSEGHWEAAEPFDGWRITATEDAIDKMIAALQKAKRQAFPAENREPVGTTMEV